MYCITGQEYRPVGHQLLVAKNSEAKRLISKRMQDNLLVSGTKSKRCVTVADFKNIAPVS